MKINILPASLDSRLRGNDKLKPDDDKLKPLDDGCILSFPRRRESMVICLDPPLKPGDDKRKPLHDKRKPLHDKCTKLTHNFFNPWKEIFVRKYLAIFLRNFCKRKIITNLNNFKNFCFFQRKRKIFATCVTL